MRSAIKHGLGLLLAVGSFVAIGSSAGADTLRFYTNTGTYTGQWNTSAAFTDVNPAAKSCPTVGTCTSDNIQATEFFTSAGGVSVTASVNGNNGVWGDYAPSFGGLGVSSSKTSASGDDQIDAGQILTLSFSTSINLLGVLTLFDSAHSPFNGNVATGNIVINGIIVSLSNANNETLGGLFSNVTSLAFSIGANSGVDPEYYVSGLVFSATPIPAALPLFATGVGALGLLGWRRKHKAKAAA